MSTQNRILPQEAEPKDADYKDYSGMQISCWQYYNSNFKQVTYGNRVEVGNLGTAYDYNGYRMIVVKLPILESTCSQISFKFENAFWMPHDYDPYNVNNQKVDTTLGLFKFSINTVAPQNSSSTSYSKIITEIDKNSYRCCVVSVGENSYGSETGYATLRSYGKDSNPESPTILDNPMKPDTQYYLWIYSPSNTLSFKLFNMRGISITSKFQFWAGKHDCKVNYDHNGKYRGVVPSGYPKDVLYGETIEVDFSKTTDYPLFTCWTDDDGNVYDSNNRYATITKDTTFSACWASEYILTYNLDKYFTGNISEDLKLSENDSYDNYKVHGKTSYYMYAAPGTKLYTPDLSKDYREYDSTFKVTLDPCGGSIDGSVNKKVFDSERYKILSLEYWYLENDKAVTVQPGASYVLNKDSNFAMKIEQDKYVNESINLPIPVRYGYEFIHWMDDSGRVFQGNSTYTPEKDNVELRAVWYPTNYVYISTDRGYEKFHIYIYDKNRWDLYFPEVYTEKSGWE